VIKNEKMKIKQYEWIKKEIGVREFSLPTVPVYFFETGIRRAIRIIPVSLGEDKIINAIEITFVYNSSECKIEVFSVPVTEIEDIYHLQGERLHRFFVNWIDGDLNTRTKEQFDGDLQLALNQIINRTYFI